MLKSKPKSLSQLIESPGSAIGRLAATARQKLALTEHVRAGLPDALGTELLHCSLDDDGAMIVRVSSPEWAARLRFETESLLSLARQIHPETTSVKVRVAHPQD
ncbi:MAG: DciA family protein [Gammaproteobacteria bacterium]